MKKIISTLILLNTIYCLAQIGVNTTNPLALLHVQSISNSIPTIQVTGKNAHVPILTVTDNRNIGVNILNDNTATIILDSENKGNSGIRLFNHSNAVTYSNLDDLAIDNSGIVVSRGNDIGKTFIAFKANDSNEFSISAGIIEDDELVLTLPKGKYELTGSLVFHSGTNNDLELYLSGVGDVTGKFNAIGQYGSFTNSINAVTFYERDINSTVGVALGGGGTKPTDISGASINGFITVNSGTAVIKLKYKQQAGLFRDSKVYKNTFIKALKIQ
jgi:hypothetical protein